MPFTKGDISVKQVSETHWELLKSVTYKGNHETFVVPAGFQTDFASVPRVFTWLQPTYGVYTKSAILHDYISVHTDLTGSDADGIFRRSMRELGVPFLRRWMMWAAVRVGSKFDGMGLAEFLLWLLVAAPSVVFMVIPAIIVTIWLLVFWLIEVMGFIILKPWSRKQVNFPRIMMGSDEVARYGAHNRAVAAKHNHTLVRSRRHT